MRTTDDLSAASEPHRIQQRGLWFEEFSVGCIYAHRPGRTVTEADNVQIGRAHV